MPSLHVALGLRPGETVALVGGGGKTTALYRLLAEAAAGGGRALGTTTTRMWPPEPGRVDALLEAADLETARRQVGAQPASVRRLLVARPRSADGKLSGIPAGWVAPLGDALPGRVLTAVEADGAAGRPLKGAGPHEPVTPPLGDCLVPVVGADAVGAPLSPAVVHRPDRFAAQAALAVGRTLRPGEAVPPQAIAGVLLHPRGLLRGLPAGARVVPLVTRLGAGRHGAAARALVDALLARGARRVVLADLPAAPEGAAALAVVEAPASRVAAVLLAAGRGERMGEGAPKPLRLLEGRPLIEHAVAAALASGLREVIVVVGHAADEVATHLAAWSASRRAEDRARLRVVVNARHLEGQGASVAAGARALPPDATGALFLLADQPLVRGPLVDRLLAEHAARTDRLLVPTVDGRRGNPVLFPADVFPALAALAGERGGRAVLERLPDRVREVETGDPAVLLDLDTPQDLQGLEAGPSPC